MQGSQPQHGHLALIQHQKVVRHHPGKRKCVSSKYPNNHIETSPEMGNELALRNVESFLGLLSTTPIAKGP